MPLHPPLVITDYASPSLIQTLPEANRPITDIDDFLAEFGSTSIQSGNEDAAGNDDERDDSDEHPAQDKAPPLITDELLLPPTPPGPGSTTSPDAPPVLPPGVAAPPLPGGQVQPAPGPADQLLPGPAEQLAPAPTEPLTLTNPATPDARLQPDPGINPVSHGAGSGGSGASHWGGFGFGSADGAKGGYPTGGAGIGGLAGGSTGFGGLATGFVAGGAAFVARRSIFDDGASQMGSEGGGSAGKDERSDPQPDDHPPLNPTLSEDQIQAMRAGLGAAVRHWRDKVLDLQARIVDVTEANTSAKDLQSHLLHEIDVGVEDLASRVSRIAEDNTVILKAQMAIEYLKHGVKDGRENIFLDERAIRDSEAEIEAASAALDMLGDDVSGREELADTIVSQSNSITETRNNIATMEFVRRNAQAAIDEWQEVIRQNETDIVQENEASRTTHVNLLRNRSTLDQVSKTIADNIIQLRALEKELAAANDFFEQAEEEQARINAPSDGAPSHYLIPYAVYYGTDPHADGDERFDDDGDSRMGVDDDGHPAPPPATLPPHPTVHIGITPPPTVLGSGTGATHTTTTGGTYGPSEAQSGSHRADGPTAGPPVFLNLALHAGGHTGGEDVDIPDAQELILIGAQLAAWEDSAARPT